MSLAYDFSQLKDALKKIEERLKEEYSHVHTGRATPVLLDPVQVLSYGSYMQIKSIASITVEDPKTLRVVSWDKNQIKDIEKAILSSDLGLSVIVDNDGLRVKFPPMTTERKEKLVKILKDKLEGARIQVRQERDRVWDDIQQKVKTSDLTEDDKFLYKDELQKLINETNINLEDLFDKKEKDLTV